MNQSLSPSLWRPSSLHCHHGYHKGLSRRIGQEYPLSPCLFLIVLSALTADLHLVFDTLFSLYRPTPAILPLLTLNMQMTLF